MNRNNIEMFLKYDDGSSLENGAGVFTLVNLIAVIYGGYCSKHTIIDIASCVIIISLIIITYVKTDKISNDNKFKIRAANGIHFLVGSVAFNYTAFQVISQEWKHPLALFLIISLTTCITLACVVLHIYYSIKRGKYNNKISVVVKGSAVIGASIGVAISRTARNTLADQGMSLFLGVTCFVLALLFTNGINPVIKYCLSIRVKNLQ